MKTCLQCLTERRRCIELEIQSASPSFQMGMRSLIWRQEAETMGGGVGEGGVSEKYIKTEIASHVSTDKQVAPPWVEFFSNTR